MKNILLVILGLLTFSFAQAQCNEADYHAFIAEGDALFNQKKYEKAIKKYASALIACRDNGAAVQQKTVAVFKKIEELKNDADRQKNIAKEALKKVEEEKEKTENALKKAEEEKKKAQEALAKAEEMQIKAETATFDKAVKERAKEWKGYANLVYDGTLTNDGKEILSKIDSLDLSASGLLRIPKEVLECPNLKHINLLGNIDIDWQQSSGILSKLKPETGLYVSVLDLDDIPKAHWKNITGIRMAQVLLSEIPANILEQKQLVYLNISGVYKLNNKFNTLPKKLFELTNLEYLNLGFCQIATLPAEIGELKALTSLNLGNT